MAQCRFFRYVLPALLVLLLVPASGKAADTVRLVIGRPIAAQGSLVYRITVVARGAPVVAILPEDTRLATLEVNGIVVERVGRAEFLSHRPLAHGGASLLLTDLRPGDRILLRLRGTREPPRLVADGDVLARSYTSGTIAGSFYGLLATAMLLQLLAIFGNRQWARLWYFGALCVMLCVETLRNDVWHLQLPQALTMLGASGMLAALTMTGFAATYLRLRTQARGLFWFVIIGNLAPGVLAASLISLTWLRPSDALNFVPAFLGNASLIVAAALRYRAGFKPAALLLFGLCALCTFFALQIGLASTGTSLGWFDWWGFEVAAAVDVLLFSLALSYRDDFFKREQSEMEGRLRSATFAAEHDSLTGLLNRRGLEVWTAGHPGLVATMLYLDIDGFKAVNDRGGHAAGDDALRLVARIIRHAVREGDQIARMGGDEFLVLLIDVHDSKTAREATLRIVSSVGSLRPLGADDDTRIGMSVGLGQLGGEKSFSDALSQADKNLYRRKSEHQALARIEKAFPGSVQ